MLFNSPLFLFIFLPLAWVGFHLCARFGHRMAKGWLVGASLLFYGWWTPPYLILLCGSILFNYTTGVLLQKTAGKGSRQMAILTVGVTANLCLLGYYKYLFPLLNWASQYGLHLVPPGSSVILPFGISFFTFTQIGYLVDCKAGLTAGRRFLDYALFVTFFPHLIAGPILHHREMMPQFDAEETWRFRIDKIAVGLSIFFIGLAKKDIIADYFAVAADVGYGSPGGLTTAHAWCAVLSYSMQLYFDFSGYSDMAIGLALLFNIRFPANFDSPYKSCSVIEYWQRWNITLTRYLNLYLYNPMALWVTRWRAERRLPVGRQGLKTMSGFLSMVIFPTFCTMILIGIWHGAGGQFVIFGLLHAIYLSTNQMWQVLFHKKNAPEPSQAMRWFTTAWQVVLTFLAIVLAQIFFRSASVSGAFAMLENMAGHHAGATTLPLEAFEFKKIVLSLVGGFIFVWAAPNVLQIFSAWEPTLSKPLSPGPKWYGALQWKPTLPWAIAVAIVAAAAILAISGTGDFIYFRF